MCRSALSQLHPICQSLIFEFSNRNFYHFFPLLHVDFSPNSRDSVSKTAKRSAITCMGSTIYKPQNVKLFIYYIHVIGPFVSTNFRPPLPPLPLPFWAIIISITPGFLVCQIWYLSCCYGIKEKSIFWYFVVDDIIRRGQPYIVRHTARYNPIVSLLNGKYGMCTQIWIFLE